MTRNQRLSFLGVATVIAIAAIVVLTAGGGPDQTAEEAGDQTSVQQTPTPPATATAEPEDTSTPTPTPKPQPPLLQAGEVAKLRFTEGETVRFRVRHDTPEHVHVHGYDLMQDLEPGKTATVSFKATITGIFEIELEDSAQEIAQLRVDPR